MSPVVGPPGWKRPEPGKKIALGAHALVTQEAVDVVIAPAAGERPQDMDAIDAVMPGAFEAASNILAGGGLSAMGRRQAGEGSPIKQILARQPVQQQPTEAAAFNLDGLSNRQLRKLQDDLAEKMIEKDAYSYGDDDAEDDVDDFAQVEDESADYAAEYTQQGVIEGAL
jgi:hypothetical protein